jgi:hypothetical protein
MHYLDRFLITDETPDGIIGFELVKNIHEARIMLDIWGDKGRIVAAFSLGIDYLFLISYSLFLGLTSYILALNLNNRFNLLSKIGHIASWLILLAGIYDAIENFALFKIMTGCQLSIWATTAWFFASIKFAIVYAVLIYIVLALVFKLLFLKTVKNEIL